MTSTLISSRILDLFQQEGRTRGRHVSSAIHRVMKTLHPDRFDDSPIDEMRALLGNAMESAIARGLTSRYPGRYHVIGQIEYDGILGYPDLYDVHELAPVEIKFTWASSKRAADIEDPWFWRYRQQLMSYATMLGSNKGFLIIVFVNGDYKGGGPKGYEWQFDWTEEELAEAWSLTKMYATPDKEPEDQPDKGPEDQE